MDDVKRYKPEWDDLRGKWILPIEMANLDVVLHTDYAKLQADRDTALEQVAKLTAALEYCSDGGDNCQDHSTVALAELKAERGRG